MTKISLDTLHRFMEHVYAGVARESTTDELFQILPPGVCEVEVEDGSVLTRSVASNPRGENERKSSLVAGSRGWRPGEGGEGGGR